jgi:hypothetical protein
VHIGSDGKVRAADMEYKVPGEVQFRLTTRPIHKLVLVMPVEEQTVEEDEGGEANPEPEAGGQYGEDDGARWEENKDGSEAGETRVGKKLPPRETAGRPEEEVQCEEASSRPKEKTYPASPVVKFSDGLEEMVDVGVALKRGRGRPRKAGIESLPAQGGTDPPDPHKGSVTDGAEEVCVDPGEMGAILGAGGPPGRGKGGQLASDSGGG